MDFSGVSVFLAPPMLHFSVLRDAIILFFWFHKCNLSCSTPTASSENVTYSVSQQAKNNPLLKVHDPCPENFSLFLIPYKGTEPSLQYKAMFLIFPHNVTTLFYLTTKKGDKQKEATGNCQQTITLFQFFDMSILSSYRFD